jgi:hypothetical protein
VLDRRNELRARWETLSRNELEDAIEAVRARGGARDSRLESMCLVVGTCSGRDKSIESETHLGWKVGCCCCLAVSCKAVKVKEVKLLAGKWRPFLVLDGDTVSRSTLTEGDRRHIVNSEQQVAFTIPLEHSTHARVINTYRRRTLR